MRIRVKMCGMTRVQDALAASALGVDAIGLVFYPPSARCVSVEQARAISRALPPFVTRVGLFVDAPGEEVRAIADAVGLEMLQFHGEEPEDVYAAFGRPYIKAVRMRAGLDLGAYAGRYPRAAALLVDSYVPDVAGGSGQSFDWRQVPADLGKPVILAGGLTAENVCQAIMQVHPFAVDVSSGIEASAGTKDLAKMHAFMQRVRECQ